MADPTAWRAWHASRLGRAFDRKHGTDTQALIEVSELGLSDEPLKHAVHYEASSLPKLHRALRHLGVDEGRYTFVDVGSGKGLVVIEAAKRRFREVVGLEISALAHEIAEKNLAAVAETLSLRAQVKLLNLNALDYEFPADRQIIYLYNPFSEAFLQPLLEKLLHRLADSATDVVIAYVNPVYWEAIRSRFPLEVLYTHRSLVVFRLHPPMDRQA